ncbi:MAG: hypothetical protein ACXVXN_02105 [Mycobacteriaceae bacterium]
MRRLQLVSALVRLIGLGLIGASGWAVTPALGLVSSGAAVLAVVYLPEGGA